MTIEKAIEILNHLPIPLKTAEDHDAHLAVNLGIEALKRIQEQRSYRFSNMNRSLPNETEE